MNYLSKTLSFALAVTATLHYNSSLGWQYHVSYSYQVLAVYYKKTGKYLVQKKHMHKIRNAYRHLKGSVIGDGKQLTNDDFQECYRLPTKEFAKVTTIFVKYVD